MTAFPFSPILIMQFQYPPPEGVQIPSLKLGELSPDDPLILCNVWRVCHNVLQHVVMKADYRRSSARRYTSATEGERARQREKERTNGRKKNPTQYQHEAAI